MKRVVIILAVWCCLFSGSIQAQDNVDPLPSSIGPIDLSEMWADAEPFFHTYGKGLPCEGKFPTYWYHIDDFLWVEIGRYHGENRPLNRVMVSRYPTVPCYFPPGPSVSFGPMVTEQGLGLGDSVEKVLALYGTPYAEYTDPTVLWRLIPNQWHGYTLGVMKVLEFYPRAYSDDIHGLPRLVFTVYLEDDVVVGMALESPPG